MLQMRRVRTLEKETSKKRKTGQCWKLCVFINVLVKTGEGQKGWQCGSLLPLSWNNGFTVCQGVGDTWENGNVWREERIEGMSLNTRCMPLTEQNFPELSKERKTLKPGEHKIREYESSLEAQTRWPQEGDGSLQNVLGGEIGRSLHPCLEVCLCRFPEQEQQRTEDWDQTHRAETQTSPCLEGSWLVRHKIGVRKGAIYQKAYSQRDEAGEKDEEAH